MNVPSGGEAIKGIREYYLRREYQRYQGVLARGARIGVII